MHVFESVLLLLLGATVLSAFARRMKIAYPTVIAVGGAILAFVPGAPRLEVPPDLILALFVAPVLLDAAYDTSLRDLRRNWVPITSLALVAVAATTAGVALATRTLVPDMPWAAAIALGGLLAPPDAVSSLAVLKHARPPHRLRVILECESLLNDATALLIYRLAVGAIAAGSFTLTAAAPTFALVFLGSVVGGWLAAKPVLMITNRITDPPSSVVFQFVMTFGVWLTAERLGLSGVITIVVFGLTMARRTSSPMPANLRLPSFAIWETVIMVLNVLAYTLIGLQLAPIVAGLTEVELTRYLWSGIVLLAVVVTVRITWVFMHHGAVVLAARMLRTTKEPFAPPSPTAKDAMVVSWSGMRGIVTLAAAMALPMDFPHRDFIQIAAFVVVLGTLLIQGLTLRPLIHFLRLPKDSVIETEIRMARHEALRSIVASLENAHTPAAQKLKQEYAEALLIAAEGNNPRDTETNELRRKALVVARNAIENLRSAGAIGDTAYRSVEEELDELDLSTHPERD